MRRLFLIWHARTSSFRRLYKSLRKTAEPARYLMQACLLTIWKQAIAPPISAGLNRNHPRIYVLPPDPRTDPVQNCLQSILPIARAFRGAKWALFVA